MNDTEKKIREIAVNIQDRCDDSSYSYAQDIIDIIDTPSSPHPEAREEAYEIGTPREFAERLAWMAVNGKPDLDQWENHIKFRDAALSRLAAPKHEGRTISWQLINDIIDETLEEEAAPLECAIQVILAANGYTAINEPVAPEPRPAEEDAIQASEVKKAMSYNGRAVCDWKGARDTLAAEVRALRSQLARKDEATRLIKAIDIVYKTDGTWLTLDMDGLHACFNLGDRRRGQPGYDSILGRLIYKWSLARAALREPDGRKGE